MDSDFPTSMRITSSGPAARLLPPHPNDVVCVPKRYATDQTASQQPVLVLPQSFLNRLQSASPSISRPARPTHADRRATWLELADSLLRQHPESVQVARSIRYLIRIGKGCFCATALVGERQARNPPGWFAHMQYSFIAFACGHFESQIAKCKMTKISGHKAAVIPKHKSSERRAQFV